MERDDFLRRGGPEHASLTAEIESLKLMVAKLNDTLDTTTRQLVGEWDDVKHEWRPGVLQEMQTIRKAIVGMSFGFKWLGGIAVAVLAPVLTALLVLALQNHAHIQAIGAH